MPPGLPEKDSGNSERLVIEAANGDMGDLSLCCIQYHLEALSVMALLSPYQVPGLAGLFIAQGCWVNAPTLVIPARQGNPGRAQRHSQDHALL